MGLRRPPSARNAARCYWAFLLVLPTTLHGQGVVRSATVEVDLTVGGGAATVRVEYGLSLEDGVGEATVGVLVPNGSTVGDIVTNGQRVTLRPAGATRQSASVSVEPSSGNERTLIAEYRVEGAVREENGSVRARVPVLSVSLPPTEGGDVLQASVRIPTGWSVSERFPTGLREAGEGVYGVSLPVVPSVVSLRGRTDGAWRPGFGLILELLTATILVGFGATTWRRLTAVVK